MKFQDKNKIMKKRISKKILMMEKRANILEEERLAYHIPKFFKSFRKPELLTEIGGGLLKGFIQMLRKGDWTGKTINLGNDIHIKISDITDEGFKGKKYYNTKTGPKLVDDAVVEVKFRDLLDSRIFGPAGSIQKHFDEITDVDKLIAYLNKPLSDTTGFYSDISQLYTSFAKKFLGDQVSPQQVEEAITNMINGKELQQITNIIEEISKDGAKIGALTPREFMNMVSERLKYVNGPKYANMSVDDTNQKIMFLMDTINSVHPGMAKKIDDLMAKKGLNKSDGDFHAGWFGKVADEDDIIKNIGTGQMKIPDEAFENIDNLKKFLKGEMGKDVLDAFIDNAKYVAPSLWKKIWSGLNTYVLKTIREYPWLIQNIWSKAFYRRHLDFDHLWNDLGKRKWGDLDTPTQNYLRDKWGVKEGTTDEARIKDFVDSNGQLDILNPAINKEGKDINSGNFKVVDDWFSKDWKKTSKEFNELFWGYYKLQLKKTYDKGWPGWASNLRQGMIPAIMAGIYAAPEITAELIYKYFSLHQLDGATKESILQAFAEMKAQGSNRCITAAEEQYKIENPNAPREEMVEWIFEDEGWKDVDACLNIYRKTYMRMSNMETKDLMPLMWQHFWGANIVDGMSLGYLAPYQDNQLKLQQDAYKDQIEKMKSEMLGTIEDDIK